MCGVHYVPLLQKNFSIDLYAPHLGHIAAWICPVSGQLAEDNAQKK
jgi:hypothetical protein